MVGCVGLHIGPKNLTKGPQHPCPPDTPAPENPCVNFVRTSKSTSGAMGDLRSTDLKICLRLPSSGRGM